MKVWTRRLFGVVCLNVLLALGSGACSSSQQQGENLESTSTDEQANQQGEEDEQQEQQGQQEELAQQEDEQGNGNFNAENMDAGDNNLTENGAAQADATENDLQEIISEMDQGNAAQANPMDQGQQMQVNDQQAQAQENAAVAQQDAQPAMNAAVDTATTSAGGVIGGAQGQTAGQGLPELGSKMPYIVHSGDTLAGISKKIYGTPARWREISALSGLDNPNSIYPGDVVYYQLTQEAVAFAQAYTNAPRQEIVVQQGDTLATISKRAFGSGRFWKSIWRENDHIVNPDQLVVGQTIFYMTDEALSAAVDSKREDLRTISLAQSDAKDNVTTNADKSDSDFEFQTEDLTSLVKINVYAVATNS
jgi:nucleoid-associated protein YgaU